jgi:hypothetical protein
VLSYGTYKILTPPALVPETRRAALSLLWPQPSCFLFTHTHTHIYSGYILIICSDVVEDEQGHPRPHSSVQPGELRCI